jgi:hypothetical protein
LLSIRESKSISVRALYERRTNATPKAFGAAENS